MNIQSNINQTMSLASMLLTLNPAVNEARGLRKERETLEKARDVMYNESLKTVPSPRKSGAQATPEDLEASASRIEKRSEYTGQMAEKSKQLFELNPSEQTYATWQKDLKAQNTSMRLSELFRKEAQNSLMAKQEQKRASRRNFLDYIKDEPSSFGSKVGELDPKLQKEIARTYSKSERQKIMNRKDAMNE